MNTIDNAALPGTGIVHVTHDSQLASALALLAPGPYLALDTEFLRESTYYAKLCLVQLANAHGCVVVDVLALSTLTPLLDFLLDRSRLKVLHAARQDLEVLTQAQDSAVISAQVPGPIFDTQIAGGLLGFHAQIGYGELLSRRLDINLTKGLARTDWSRRPLSDEQFQYAADDVRYLGPLYESVRAELEQRERLGWLQEETQAMEDLTLYRTLPQDAWQRLRGLAQLRPEQRAATKRLAEWRELRAIQSDKPRGWILSDEALRALGERLPKNLEAHETIRDLPPGVARKQGEALLTVIAESASDAANEAPARDFRASAQQQAEVAKLMKHVRITAERLRVSPEVLATRRDVEQLVYFDKPDAFMHGWRQAAIGESLLALHQATRKPFT
jgi:ribonuclease D